MATKGNGHLQQAGRFIACKLKYTLPFPFLPVNIDYWAALPYVVDADINYAKNILQNSQYHRTQLTKIIRYAREYLRDKSSPLNCTDFINIDIVL